jgi:hypothetical protein
MKVRMQIICEGDDDSHSECGYKGVWSNQRKNKCELKDNSGMMMYKRQSVKKECYKRLHHNKSDENIHKYKEARRNTKKAVSEARGQTYAELYRKLDTKEGENYVYKMVKLQERKTRVQLS